MQLELSARQKANLIALLHECRQKKDQNHAMHLHAYMCQQQLDSDPVLGNYLVPMLVDCGSLIDAHHVFDRLSYRNEYSWNSLISGYINIGESRHAFELYDKMQEEACVQPTMCAYLALLSACTLLHDTDTGQGLHARIVCRGLERNLFLGSPVLGNTLVDMYCKCGFLAEAHYMFDRLPLRNSISWNALITGYAEHGLCEEVLNCFKEMQIEGVLADAVTLVLCIKACGNRAALESGREINTEIVKIGLERCLHPGSTLVDMYGKCGSVAEAKLVFDRLLVRDRVSWTALVAAYAEQGLDDDVLKCFGKMQMEGVSADAVMVAYSLKACGSKGELRLGWEVYAGIIKKGLEREICVGSAVVDMYTRCGSIAEACDVFNQLSVQDSISLNALIAGYIDHELYEEVVNIFKQVQLGGLPADAVTFILCLKSCHTSRLDIGRAINGEIANRGLERASNVGNALVYMYGKCGALAEALQVFDMLPIKDVDSWIALLLGYADHGLHETVLGVLKQMQLEGVCVDMDAGSFVICLRSLTTMQALETGREIHASIMKMGMDKELQVGNSLVDMYGKCGSLMEAQHVFERLAVRDAVSWNSLFAGYIDQGLGEQALNCFKQMLVEDVFADDVTFLLCLKACGTIRALEIGQKVHDEITRRGLESEHYMGNTLVDMYGKCGCLSEAHRVLDKLQIRNTISWTILIAGYAEGGLDENVLNCFKQMQLEDVFMDAHVFVMCLKSCGNIGALETGREIHAETRMSGLDRGLIVGNALVDMYGKCGSVAEGREVFDKLLLRDVASWTAMIHAYGENHKADMAVQCFLEMQEHCVKPDCITFTCLLAACSRASLVLEGQEYFRVMQENYNIKPTLDHYACMVDLFARSGHVYEAGKFLTAMKCPAPGKLITVLLNACKNYEKLEMGERCFQQLVEVNQEDAAAYLLMGDIYASAGRWRDANRLEELRKFAGAKKKPASVIIEVNKELHEFVVGVRLNEDILGIVGSLRIKDQDYIPMLELALGYTSDEPNIATSYELGNYSLCATNLSSVKLYRSNEVVP